MHGIGNLCHINISQNAAHEVKVFKLEIHYLSFHSSVCRCFGLRNFDGGDIVHAAGGNADEASRQSDIHLVRIVSNGFLCDFDVVGFRQSGLADFDGDNARSLVQCLRHARFGIIGGDCQKVAAFGEGAAVEHEIVLFGFDVALDASVVGDGSDAEVNELKGIGMGSHSALVLADIRDGGGVGVSRLCPCDGSILSVQHSVKGCFAFGARALDGVSVSVLVEPFKRRSVHFQRRNLRAIDEFDVINRQCVVGNDSASVSKEIVCRENDVEFLGCAVGLIIQIYCQ